MIALLLEKVFTLSIIVSQLEDKIDVLSAEIALRTHSEEQRLDSIEDRAKSKEPEKRLQE